MVEKSSANIGFEKQVWVLPASFRGHIPAAEYRNGLIPLRYISSAFKNRHNELAAFFQEEFERDIETRISLTRTLDFILAH